MTTLFDFPTPSLVLDRSRLERNCWRMAKKTARHWLDLRPYSKTPCFWRLVRFSGFPYHPRKRRMASGSRVAGRNIVMKKLALCATIACAGTLVAFAATAAELKEVQVEKFGYKLKLPADFVLEGKPEATSQWIRGPKSGGSAEPAAASETKEKKGLGGKLKTKLVGEKNTDETASSGGSSEGALTVYVNWTYMPDVASDSIYKTVMDDMKQKADGPNPTYKDIKPLEIKGGKAFWYKEVDKSAGDEIHRWHIQAYGNKSVYTVGLTGAYGQFKDWAATYEEVIKSFELVPIKE